MEHAAFSLIQYKFDKVYLDFENKISSEIEVNFHPSAVFKNNKIELTLLFNAFNHGKEESPYVRIRCIAVFEFNDEIEFQNIPAHFYQNSIAIIFPYIRSFISTVTLQANIMPPILLPTWNLTALGETLKKHTIKEM